MIAALKGKLLSKDAESAVIDVRGVGYQVFVCSPSFSPKIGDEVQLIIYTDVKENSISLFGFSQQQEKEVFLLLKKVKGIGSKLAASIVFLAGAEEILSAIGREDVTSICKVPGVGKKTAERIVVELREQVAEYASSGGSIEVRQIAVSNDSSVVNDTVLALEKLGFSSQKAKDSIAAALKAGEEVKLLSNSGDLLKSALAHL